MELKDYIENAEKSAGGRQPLADILGQNADAITGAKAHRRGLPNFACIKIADMLGVDRLEVIAASELVTEKKPERREVWLPIVLAAEAREIARTAEQSTAQNATAETTTAPVRESSKEEMVASRGIEPRTRGFSIQDTGIFPLPYR